jgi:hypothetical protein
MTSYFINQVLLLQVPSQQEIEELQRFYHVQKGVKPQEFPPHYPTSCLLGCVDVVDVLPQEEYRSVEVPE